MPHRDPETGRFRSLSFDEFDRIEQIHNDPTYSVAAAQVGGQTGQTLGQSSTFEDVQVADFGDIMDRTELGVLLWAYHSLVVYISSTQSADGTVRSEMEISLSSGREDAGGVIAGTDIDDQGDFTIDGGNEEPRNATDLVGPILRAVGFGPFSDGGTGVGGAGTAGQVEWEGPPMVRPLVDATDELLNHGAIQHSNVSDAALHAELECWWVVGVLED